MKTGKALFTALWGPRRACSLGWWNRAFAFPSAALCTQCAQGAGPGRIVLLFGITGRKDPSGDQTAWLVDAHAACFLMLNRKGSVSHSYMSNRAPGVCSQAFAGFVPNFFYSSQPAGPNRKALPKGAPELVRIPELAGGEFGRDLLRHKGLDRVAHLDVVEVRNADAALHAVRHFFRIVLETLERGQLALEHRHAVAH